MNWRRAVGVSVAALITIMVLGLLVKSVMARGSCWYYGYQTERETKYAPFVGCMAQIGSNWVPTKEIRTVGE